jgi:hypothetical protein
MEIELVYHEFDEIRAKMVSIWCIYLFSGWWWQIIESQMRNIEFSVFDDHTVPQVALRHSIHSGQQSLLDGGHIDFILWFLVAGQAVVLAGEVISQLRKSIWEDSFIQPCEKFLILEEKF